MVVGVSGAGAPPLPVTVQCPLSQLQFNDLQVVGHDDAALEVLGGFARVGIAASRERLFLCMVEYEVLHSKLAGKLAGIKGCAVVLLVGLSIASRGVYSSACSSSVYALDPSKQWVHTLHFGKPMAAMSCSMVLNFSDVSPSSRRISSTMRL